MVIWLVPLLCVLLAVLAEVLHARRCRRVAFLAFGPAGAPRSWVAAVPLLRVAALGSLAWGLTVLLLSDGGPPSKEVLRDTTQHLVVGLDVSPSMKIVDAGPHGDQLRAKRAAEVLRSVLSRLDMRRTRTSILAFYSTARPVVVDTTDPEVVINIIDDLPLEHVFAAGKTNLYSTVEAANPIAETWRRGSATLLIVSDGDTLPATRIPELAPAYGSVLVVGVGDEYRGTYIDGHDSRQEATGLRQLALRLRGRYVNANERHVPSEAVAGLSPVMAADAESSLSLRDWAVVAVLAGGAVLATLGPALALAGTSWNPMRAASRFAWQPT